MTIRIVSTQKVSSGQVHEAFTGLASHAESWFCCYRQATSHTSADGRVVVAARPHRPGSNSCWRERACLQSPDARLPDLRDPKIVMIDELGLLLLATATARHAPASCQSYVWLSTDGVVWSDPTPVGDPDYWLWSITVQDRWLVAAGYAFSGAGRETSGAQLWRADIGDLRFACVGPLAQGRAEPNETALHPDGKGLVALVRRRFTDCTATHQRTRNGSALLGTCTHAGGLWTWKDTGVFIGGPTLARIADGSLIAGGRSLSPRPHTALWSVDQARGKLTELVALPSDGIDCGYPGIVAAGAQLYVTHYSTVRGATCVYFSHLTIDPA